ncbi:hypothetical protein ANCDUO_03589 [Ancylostoma duodenale]|uniref:Uncharacterized protein n=1 Tax=Ancylostoma duodenale TaxID=51022 RepID=A0A0C2GX29_9BILA|nr:hypothetical protein ANCDUO_03589 [Ancylostoma duodenale]
MILGKTLKQSEIIMQNGMPFGGKSMVLGENFGQVLHMLYEERGDTAPRHPPCSRSSVPYILSRIQCTVLHAHPLQHNVSLTLFDLRLRNLGFTKQNENAIVERSIGRVMLGVARLTQVRAGRRSSTLRQQSKIRDATAYAKLSKIRGAGLHGTSNAQQEDHRPDDQTSSRIPLKKGTMLSVSLERTEPIGQPWLARGTNGRIAGARSIYPKTNGSQGNQSDLAR